MKYHNQTPYTQDGTMRWWIGMVEARNDPLQLGRVQVRIFGYHTDDKSLIATEDLPWSTPLGPTDSAALSGVGSSPTGMMIGTRVVGFWGDYPDCQMPIVIGTMYLQEGYGGDGLFSPYNNLIGDNSSIGQGTVNTSGDGPSWLQIARQQIAISKEWAGLRHNPDVMKYARETGLTSNDRSHTWAGVFVRWCLKEAGIDVTGLTATAKSVATSSAFERIEQPIYGCIVTKNRSSPDAKGHEGHSGFWVGRQGASDLFLGANTGNKISIAPHPVRTNHGYWWPKGQSKTFSNTGSSYRTSDQGGGASSGNTSTGTRGVGGNTASKNFKASTNTDPSGRSNVSYVNGGATRNQPIQSNLLDKISSSVKSVYGSNASAQIYSGGQPSASKGSRRTGSIRHDNGYAADVYIYDGNGNRLTSRKQLQPIANHWRNQNHGSVGMVMRGGGVHLDLWGGSGGPPLGKGMGYTWSY